MKNPLKDSLARRLRAVSRHRSPPSERNVRVFEEVEVKGRRQTEVAAELGISQGRVAQICRAVGRWCREECDPVSLGPEQFRELADLLCEMAFLRLIAERGGQSPQSASRQEIFWHAARAYAALGPNPMGPSISASNASISSDDFHAFPEELASGRPALNNELPVSSSETCLAGAAANPGLRNRV